MPAVVGMLAMAVVVWWQTRREDMSSVVRASKRDVARLFMVALPAKHALARQTHVAPADLANETLLLLGGRNQSQKFAHCIGGTAA